ncbi:MAG: hypothetical protein M0R17_03385 [Candidatus Omnitrophica bacterium]|jgi:hypothetical protein|nr:hypothetical protein [Candidatus Omnitrophota bacterium]
MYKIGNIFEIDTFYNYYMLSQINFFELKLISLLDGNRFSERTATIKNLESIDDNILKSLTGKYSYKLISESYRDWNRGEAHIVFLNNHIISKYKNINLRKD